MVLIIAVVLTTTVLSYFTNTKRTLFEPLPTWEVNDPVSKVFVMDEIPPTAGSLAAGDSTVPNEYLVDPAIDTLLLMMETQDIYLHQTAAQPSGIVGSDDIVIIKGNFQWNFRNTTSTDRIKGLIWQIRSSEIMVPGIDICIKDKKFCNPVPDLLNSASALRFFIFNFDI